jgi:hypothetical protein
MANQSFPRRRAPRLVGALALAAWALPVSQAFAQKVPVTTCGQYVPSGASFLAADLDCTGNSDPGVRLGRNASLDLDGFTLSGGDGDGVLCEDRCKVYSDADGGTISGFAGDGIRVEAILDPTARVAARKVAISGNTGNGVRIDAAAGNIGLRKAEVSGNGGKGAWAPDQVRVSASTIDGNGEQGVLGARPQVRDSFFTGNAVGIESSEFLKVDTCEITGNVGDGIRANITFKAQRMILTENGGSGLVMGDIDGPAKVFFSEVSDNGGDGVRVEGNHKAKLRLKYAFLRRNAGSGIVSRDYRAAYTRSDDNGLYGVLSPSNPEGCKARINRFSMSGNGTDPSCGVSLTCADIASCDPLIELHPETACATSYDTDSGFPGTSLGICYAD